MTALPSPLPASADDTALARDVATGNAIAFERLMRRHNRAMYRTARAILKDDGEAEDAVQEAYVRAWGAIGAFRGESSLATWLVRIVANEAFGRLRTRTRRAAIVPLRNDDADDVAEPEAPLMDRPDHATQRHEILRLIEARIDALPDAYRVVFVLRAVEERSVEETAACLGIPEATVRSRFFRARSLMRESLARDVDRACGDAFGFAGARCDRIVATVLARIGHVPGRDR